MQNKIYNVFIICAVIFNVGCTQEKRKIPFQIIDTIKSKNNMNIIIVKKGIKGNATVSFMYEFYFSKEKNIFKEKDLFLKIKGLDAYKIKWNSMNTIDIDLKTKRILFFTNSIRSDSGISYIVNKFTFQTN